MKNRVKPNREENLQDLDGNTALHIFAMPNPMRIPPPPIPHQLRYDMCKILIDHGVSPLVRNKQGQLPVDCLEKNEKVIRGVLELAMKRGESVRCKTLGVVIDVPSSLSLFLSLSLLSLIHI